jgi:hydrogenase expression/formation protein HypC
MSEALPACIADFDGCITCGDHAVELRVVSVDEARGLAVCADERGASTEVDVLLVAPVAPGEQVLVRADTAIARSTPAACRAPSPERGAGRPAEVTS